MNFRALHQKVHPVTTSEAPFCPQHKNHVLSELPFHSHLALRPQGIFLGTRERWGDGVGGGSSHALKRLVALKCPFGLVIYIQDKIVLQIVPNMLFSIRGHYAECGACGTKGMLRVVSSDGGDHAANTTSDVTHLWPRCFVASGARPRLACRVTRTSEKRSRCLMLI